MKRILAVILSVFLAAGAVGCQNIAPKENTQPEPEIHLSRASVQTVYGVEAPDSALQTLPGEVVPLAAKSESSAQEMRGIWLSYLSLDPMIKNKTEAQFTAQIDQAFAQIAAFGFNTVFAQVRPFGDAYYKSDYFPWSYRITGTEGKDPGYDPLKIMCTAADKYNLRIEAWLNPYRVRTNSEPMAASNQAKKWIAAGNDSAIAWNGGAYYNPGSPEARKLIVNGVREIVQNYDVDGIHFDDYFYPTTDPEFDRSTWKNSGTKLSHADWRRENVNTLVREVYAAIKQINPDCIFGISPQGNLAINYDSQYADVKKWAENVGYVDYLLPQIYYGYKNDTCPYAETVQQWDEMITADGIQLYVGLAAYKIGTVDEWAGAGKQEWVGTKDILARMVKTARQTSAYGGVAVYSYDSLFTQDSAQLRSECANLQKLF